MSSEIAARGAVDTLAVVLFTAGGCRVGLEAARVAELCQSSSAADIDDFEALFGLTPPAKAHQPPPQAMRLRETRTDILVRGPVELVQLPVARIHPLPPLLAARTGLRGLYALAILEDAGEYSLVLLFDPDLRSPAPPRG